MEKMAVTALQYNLMPPSFPRRCSCKSKMSLTVPRILGGYNREYTPGASE
jgi:hypothetical protein